MAIRQTTPGTDLGPLLDADAAGVAERLFFLAGQQSLRLRHVADVAAVPITLYTNPPSATVPIWAFMLKYHGLPSFVRCICGSRACRCCFWSMIVASTMVPCRSSYPTPCDTGLCVSSLVTQSTTGVFSARRPAAHQRIS